MQTRIHKKFAGDTDIRVADEILRTCVHCGFCNATCPTYLELGDERDGPRGRIYLIKALLEDGLAGEKTRVHLDRCLTCRSCETTCPSGVRYGRLADIGRGILERETRRPVRERLVRRVLRAVVPRRRRFAVLLGMSRLLRPVLPQTLRCKVPPRENAGTRPAHVHDRKILLLGGCVQAVATPDTNSAAARVLDRIGITTLEPGGAGCCGAMSYHLSAADEARGFIRANLDAWRPAVEAGAEAVVSLSSGCGAMLRDYAHVMRDDPDYADLAARVSAMTRDLTDILIEEDLSAFRPDSDAATAIHYPCSMTHVLMANGSLRALFESIGFEIAATREDHLCCGSAGTYSLLQPKLSQQLLDRKLRALTVERPARIVTANIGCQLHLQSRSGVPVRHWIELLDRAARSNDDSARSTRESRKTHE